MTPLALRIVAATFVCALTACQGGNEATVQGWVEANLIFVGPDEAGRIQTLSVREGDAVATTAPLFTVDPVLQVSDLQAAVASVAEARARLARLESAQQRKEEVAVLQAQEKRAEAALALSEIELERQKTLTAKGIASKAALDTAQANYNRDRASLDEIRRQIEVARMPSRMEDIAAARESLAAAQARQVAAETRLARRKVASPVEGTVQQVYYRPGEMVPAGRAVVAVLPPGNIKLRFFVAQTDVARVAVGDKVGVRCDGCPTGLTAQVNFIARTVEFTPPVIYSLEERAKLVFLVEARPERPDAFRVGQPIDVTLTRERKP